jgi:hypothetical protein
VVNRVDREAVSESSSLIEIPSRKLTCEETRKERVVICLNAGGIL